jgi:hypothetical protein
MRGPIRRLFSFLAVAGLSSAATVQAQQATQPQHSDNNLDVVKPHTTTVSGIGVRGVPP